MNDFVSLPPAERCARILRGVHRALVFQGLGSILGWPLLTLLSHRLCAAAARVVALAARLEAGTLRPGPPRERRLPSRPPAPPEAADAPPKLVLPRGFAWLLHRVPGIGFGRSQLTFLLAQPDMADLIAAAPPIAHHLRPICRMLGVKPPPGLFPPRRPRRRPAPKPAPAARKRKPASRKAPAAAPFPAAPPTSRLRPRRAVFREPPAPTASGPPGLA